MISDWAEAPEAVAALRTLFMIDAVAVSAGVGRGIEEEHAEMLRERLKYIRVLWKHEFPDEPVIIVSEIDEDQWEHRKVEIWADGRAGWADETAEHGGTRLGLEPWQDLDELNASPEFEVHWIDRAAFERVWGEHGRPLTIGEQPCRE